MKILCWNPGCARREENFPETKWDTRREKVKELIARDDWDLIALVELRNLPTSSETARAFMSSPVFEKYDVVHRRYCHYEHTFQMALFFKPGKFFVGSVKTVNYNGVPDNDKMVMFVELQSKATLKWIVFGITHFGMGETEKTNSCKILCQEMLIQDKPVLVYGDFNFFDDLDGKTQRDFMLEKFRDLANPLFSDDDQAEQLTGTFMGFPHDEHRKPFDGMSRLDHVFASSDVKPTRMSFSPHLTQYQLDNSKYSTFDYPSDHLAIAIEIEIDP